jgi:hypothetical protein
MTLTLAGLATRSYEFGLTGAENIRAISGAKQNGDHVTVMMPRGSGYQHATVQFNMK